MKKKFYNPDGTKSTNSLWLIIYATIVTILFVAYLTFGFIRLDKHISMSLWTMGRVNEQYNDLVYENEVLWTFVENLDTYKSLDDAVEWRDKSLPDLIQFVGE